MTRFTNCLSYVFRDQGRTINYTMTLKNRITKIGITAELADFRTFICQQKTTARIKMGVTM